ncbi:MAG: hypothetical protein JHD16_13155 [Solirubrobacteraceae bacterium]|nr:hypothetical protein [Solirubrobacteraceae bacterium]
MTLPTLRIVVDDREPLARFASEFADVERFGALRRGKSTVLEHLANLAARAGLAPPLVLPLSDAGFERAVGAARGGRPTLWLVLPTHLAVTASDEDAVAFLKKLALLTEPTSLWSETAWTGALVIDEAAMRELAALPAADASAWLTGLVAETPAVRDGLQLSDLHEPAALLELLSGSFSARHFNEVQQDRHLVIKRSTDVAKMRREHDAYGLLPDHLQPYFVQPFGFEEAPDGTASYRMHRLLVPDLAVQWVHRAFAPDQFDRLLEQLMRFIDERPRRAVPGTDGRAIADELYGAKVQRRCRALAATEVGARTDALLDAGGIAGGISGLHQRYSALRPQLESSRSFEELAISHGDYCFSNILYNAASRSIHLIDPRGATTVDELYSDPYYDLAKLSHSVLGGYDLIVAERTLPRFRQEMALELDAERHDDPQIAERFSAALADRGFSLPLVRLYEASLFLSMLPLHADAPRRVLALALRCAQILDALEAQDIR